ncbi:MAG: hypothetical protein DYG89_08795 [Caldilinea sp. CFX5]|nr:hypothetical protein [Caldilinea sp. CFX5]
MKQTGGRRLPTPEQEEEFMLLMSLALDKLADAGETAKFEEYLAAYPTLAVQWRSWQRLHNHFVALPSVAPTDGFVDRFEVRLLQQERRRRLWFGMAIGAITLLLWIGVLVGLASMGAYLVVNQGSWVSAFVQNLTYAWITMVQWVESGWLAFAAFAATPQAKAIGVGYLLMAAALLGGWVSLLRRSVHEQELSSPMRVA